MSQFSKVSALLKLQGDSLTSIKYTYICVCVSTKIYYKNSIGNKYF